jgi:hypothetical protein
MAFTFSFRSSTNSALPSTRIMIAAISVGFQKHVSTRGSAFSCR